MYVIVGGIIGFLVGTVFVMAKKQNHNDEMIVEEMPEDVKNTLMTEPMHEVEGIPNAAAVLGWIHQVRKQNEKNAWLTVMYYNQYFPTLRDMIISADVKIPIEQLKDHDLKAGDYVTMLFDQDKAVKLIF